MAIARVQVSTSLVGKEADFMKSTAAGAALMQKKGLRNALRISHSGVAGIEVWSTTLYEDWNEYGVQTDKMLDDSEMQEWYMSSIVNRSGQLIDTFEMAEVPGFEIGVEASGPVIAATAWRILPEDGNGGKFIKSCAEAKAMHEEHGAKPRLWQTQGGRYAGQMIYSLGFESFTTMGEWMEKVRGPQAEFMSKQPVSAVIDAQILLRPSTAI